MYFLCCIFNLLQRFSHSFRPFTHFFQPFSLFAYPQYIISLQFLLHNHPVRVYSCERCVTQYIKQSYCPHFQSHQNKKLLLLKCISFIESLYFLQNTFQKVALADFMHSKHHFLTWRQRFLTNMFTWKMIFRKHFFESVVSVFCLFAGFF